MSLILKSSRIACESPKFTDEEFDEMNQLYEETLAMLMEPEAPERKSTEFTPKVSPGTPLYTIHE